MALTAWLHCLIEDTGSGYIFLSGRHHCMLSKCCLAVHAGLVSGSPLYYAARDDRIKVAQTLLSAGADPTRGLTLLAGDDAA